MEINGFSNNLVKVNWDRFKGRFNGTAQSGFKQACYIMFCQEYNHPNGIFRYFNQPGIDTEPIDHEGSCIGFRAGFFLNGIGGKKKIFIRWITLAKKGSPRLDRILFYLPCEFREDSKGNPPKYKIEIEDHARNLGIEIEWRTLKHIEAQIMQDGRYRRYYERTFFG